MTSLHSLGSVAQTQTCCYPAELGKCLSLVSLSLTLLSEKLSPKLISLKFSAVDAVVTSVKVGVLAAPARIPPLGFGCQSSSFLSLPFCPDSVSLGVAKDPGKHVGKFSCGERNRSGISFMLERKAYIPVG